jgi:hypothetical protein
MSKANFVFWFVLNVIFASAAFAQSPCPTAT